MEGCEATFASTARDADREAVLPRETPVEQEATSLAQFLRQEMSAIARQAAQVATTGLPVGGTGARRRLRALFREQVAELARLLESYGAEEAPRLYGESQRRHAAARLAQGMFLPEALEERAIVHEAILDACGLRLGTVPTSYAKMLAASFAEVSSQAAEVWLTYQRSETAAFQEAALLETIVHHLDEAILVVEPNGLVSYATPVVEEILGLPARFFVGVQPERVREIVERLDMRDQNGRHLTSDDLPHRVALRTGEPQHEDAIRIRRMDGPEAICEFYAVPVSDEDGRLRGVILTIRDRSESYRQNEALKTAYEDLRQMHARLLSRSRLEATGELAGSAAHALNNQLNIITLRLRKLLDHPEAAEEAQAIDRSVREIASVVARLQEFAAAPREGTPEPTDVEGTVQDAIEMVRAELGPLVRPTFGLEEGAMALAEREPLLEFITTLLLGARDSTPQGEAVEVETRQEGDEAVIRIIDHGPTLSREQLDDLFEPLAPGAAARALSLSMGRQATLRWGGRVVVRPRDTGGNVFEIHLPLWFAERAAREAPQPAAVEVFGVPEEKHHRILVVDDDPDNAAMLADLLRDAEAEPVTASTGALALERGEALQPDAALVDLLLPDMEGWEVVRGLKEKVPGIRIAVVSGLSVSQEQRQSGGADAVFRKPIDTAQLLTFLGL